MCGIIGYVGDREAYQVLFSGLERLEYRGYDSAVKKRLIYINKKPKIKSMLSNIQKLRDIHQFSEMNILNYMNLENYYCQISSEFQSLLRKKINNFSRTAILGKTSRSTVSRIVKVQGHWMNIQTLLNLGESLGISNEVVLSKIINIKTHNSFPLVFNLKDLESPAFFRILGHILGDGGIHVPKSESRYRAFYTNNKQDLIDSFKKDIHQVFGNFKLYHRIRESKVQELWLPTTIGLLFYELFEYKNFQKRKRVPKWVVNTKNKKLLGHFLQAIYDDDGYLYPKKYMIVFSQNSFELTNDIRNVISKIGIKPNQMLIHRSKGKTTMHYFSITGKENFLLFNKYIGFMHPEKKKKLNTLLNNYQGKKKCVE